MGISDSPLIASIRAAVQDRPEDVPLRLHLAELLLNAGEQADAITHVAAALQRQPDSAAARELMSRAIGAPAATASVAPPVAPTDPSMSVDPGLPVEPTLPAERGLSHPQVIHRHLLLGFSLGSDNKRYVN